MNAQTCLELLRSLKDAAFATVDENNMPQARIIDVMLVEEGKLYFCTARGKDFYQQLLRNGNVAITGLTSDYQMVRLMGKAKHLAEQKKWIDRIFEENKSMNDVYPGQSRYILEPFCIDAGELEWFDLGHQPIERKSFSLGQTPVKAKGFIISETCIGCGKCAGLCPQQCITAGKPYHIEQSHCLHCGLCYENCPMEAIKKAETR